MIKFYVLFTVLVAFSSARHHGRSYDEYGDNSWDVIIFTQNWPVTECLQWKHDNANNQCNMPDQLKWTVHGMWPTKFGTKGPGFCDPDLKFDISEISSITDQLEESWLSVHGGNGADKSFWEHEWEKHGTCAAQLESLNTELKYFTKGLEWNSKYDLSSILQQAGFVPGGSPMTIDTLFSNIKSVLGANPFVSCYKNNGKTYLIDIRICFDKTLSLDDCDGIQRFEFEHPLTQDCPSDDMIYYPEQNNLQDNYIFDHGDQL